MKKLLALLLAVMMVLALSACGGSANDTAETAPAAEAGEAPAGEVPTGVMEPPEGEELGEPTGEPVAELFPADGYSKDLEGYKEYAIAALRSDEHAPADIVESTVEAIQAITDGSDSTFDMLISQGRIMSYEDFINS